MRAQTIIDTIPESSKYSVLNSLVGSINCSVIGTANSLITRLERHDFDFTELSPLEVIHMMSEADMRSDVLHNVRALIRVRNNLRDQLLAVSNDDETASWTQSIEFMTQPSATSRIDTEKLTAALSVIGLDDSTSKLMTEAAKVGELQDRARSAEQISKRQGAIEWIIEHVFSARDFYNEQGQLAEDEATGDTIEDLRAELQERLYEKLRTSIDRARTRCVQRFAIGDTRYTLNDVIILTNALNDCKILDAHYAEETL